MKEIRKHKLKSIILLSVLSILLIIFLTFSKYIFNSINDYILESKAFYFNSKILSSNETTYNINNWDGVNNYNLTIDVNNKKNELKSTLSDINYDISVECSGNVECTTSKSSGTIYQAQKTDSYQVTVRPTGNFYAGDSVVVRTKAKATYPYTKELSATYTIVVSKERFSYNIEDSVGSVYLTLNLTNSVSYYQVEQAFDTYSVGDQIAVDTYNDLSDTNKAKCFSAKVTLSIPTSLVDLDMTNNTYLNRVSGSETTNVINNYNYVSGYVFKIGASSSEKIIFYKKTINNDYTYPITNSSSIIGVSAVTAN